ncbi:hypothetical protein PVK06_021050 [Gossypium arboreum]|uniref:Uncharacterized protein n=1 Tax=Gossypium arboreum TaxID=29729 RepID=A0ABR0PP71_GOSAR|nr:hypothetical protein PVK06_021050 [Gossypium arboreum]
MEFLLKLASSAVSSSLVLSQVGRRRGLMAEDINKLFAKLMFSEEEATQVVGLNKSSLDFNGHEAWAVGRVMSRGRSNCYGGIWPNGVEILRNDVASKIDDKKRGWIGEEEYEVEKGKGKLRVGEEVSDSSSLNDRRPRGIPKERENRIRSKRKKIKGCNGKGNLESLVRMVRRKLSDGASPFKAMAGDQPRREP